MRCINCGVEYEDERCPECGLSRRYNKVLYRYYERHQEDNPGVYRHKSAQNKKKKRKKPAYKKPWFWIVMPIAAFTVVFIAIGVAGMIGMGDSGNNADDDEKIESPIESIGNEDGAEPGEAAAATLEVESEEKQVFGEYVLTKTLLSDGSRTVRIDICEGNFILMSETLGVYGGDGTALAEELHFIFLFLDTYYLENDGTVAVNTKDENGQELTLMYSYQDGEMYYALGEMPMDRYDGVGDLPAEEDYTNITNAAIEFLTGKTAAPVSEQHLQKGSQVSIDQIDVDAVPTQDGAVCVFIKNNSESVIDELEVQINYLSRDGQIIDLDTDGHDMVLPGYTVVSIMDAPDEYSSFETNASFELGVHPRYENHSGSCTATATQGEDCVIVQIANNSAVDIDEVEFVVVLYNGDEIVSVPYPKDVRDVKAGSTITEKVSTYGDEYDRFEVYLNQAHTFGF